MAATRMGANVVIPLLGPAGRQIAQGAAAAERARAAVDLRRLEIVNGFESAWRAWLAAEAQLRALDSGIVARAQDILNTAEAAYRFGERGIWKPWMPSDNSGLFGWNSSPPATRWHSAELNWSA
jgi:cobalt-zinc-cadmium efflux system outer membrane protein